jgi:hypothetical protein
MSKWPLTFLFSSLINQSPDKHYHELHCSYSKTDVEFLEVNNTNHDMMRCLLFTSKSQA